MTQLTITGKGGKLKLLKSQHNQRQTTEDANKQTPNTTASTRENG